MSDLEVSRPIPLPPPPPPPREPEAQTAESASQTAETTNLAAGSTANAQAAADFDRKRQESSFEDASIRPDTRALGGDGAAGAQPQIQPQLAGRPLDATKDSQDGTGSMAAGAVGARTGIRVPPELVARQANRAFYNDASNVRETHQALTRATADRNKEIGERKAALSEHAKNRPTPEEFQERKALEKDVGAKTQDLETARRLLGESENFVKQRQSEVDSASAELKAHQPSTGAPAEQTVNPLQEKLDLATKQLGERKKSVESQSQEVEQAKTKLNDNGAQAWSEKRKDLDAAVKGAEAKHSDIIDGEGGKKQAYEEAKAKVEKATGQKISGADVGPVSGVSVDNLTLKPQYALNENKAPQGVGEPLASRIKEVQQSSAYTRVAPEDKGNHVEVYSTDAVLKARADGLASANPVTKFAAHVDSIRGPDGQLASITGHQVWLKGEASKAEGTAQGKPAPRCPDCTTITDGVNNLAGDAGTSLTERKTNWLNRNTAASGSGMRSGAAGALLEGAIETAKTGEVDARDLAAKVGTGAAAGAVGGVIEETSARKFIGNSSSAARTVAGRLGGASLAGGIVNGGLSAYDQLKAYEEGKVTGAEAVGNVVGESAVGVGAGAAGAAIGATVGSVIPVAGTIVGGAVGFGVGVASGWLADKAARGLGVDKMASKAVTSTINGASSAWSSWFGS